MVSVAALKLIPAGCPGASQTTTALVASPPMVYEIGSIASPSHLLTWLSDPGAELHVIESSGFTMIFPCTVAATQPLPRVVIS